MAVLAARAAPARCVVLDDGVRLDLGPAAALPAGARVVADGRRGSASWQAPREPPARDQPAQGAPARDAAAVDRFLARHEVPIVEGDRCTFLWRGEADEVYLVQRIVGLPDRIPLRRLLGHRPVVPGAGAARRVAGRTTRSRSGAASTSSACNDPLNPKLSHSPVGTSSVCFAHGYETPDWTEPDPDARPGELTELVVPSRALRRDCPVTLYLPARFRRDRDLPAAGGARRRRLPAVRRGEDGAGQPDPPARRRRDRRRVPAPAGPAGRVRELGRALALPHPRAACRSWRPSCRWSASARVAACWARASARSRRCPRPTASPDAYGSLALMSGSFVFTDIGRPTTAAGRCSTRSCSS